MGLRITKSVTQKIDDQLQKMQQDLVQDQQQPKTDDNKGFGQFLKESVLDVNNQAVKAEDMGMDLATGRSGNIHETMIQTAQADLSFKLMVQVRNKALEAYNEIMRMPV